MDHFLAVLNIWKSLNTFTFYLLPKLLKQKIQIVNCKQFKGTCLIECATAPVNSNKRHWVMQLWVISSNKEYTSCVLWITLKEGCIPRLLPECPTYFNVTRQPRWCSSLEMRPPENAAFRNETQITRLMTGRRDDWRGGTAGGAWRNSGKCSPWGKTQKTDREIERIVTASQ